MGFLVQSSIRLLCLDFWDHHTICGLLYAGFSALLYSIVSDYSISTLRSDPDWIFYGLSIMTIILMGGILFLSAMSWPSPPLKEINRRSAKKSPLKKSAHL